MEVRPGCRRDARGLFSHDAPPTQRCASACKCLFPPRRCTGRTRLLLSSRLSQVPPLKGECKCVIYTCLVFYHDKAVHTLGKGGEEKRGQSLHSSPVLFHSRACDSLSCSSQRPSRGPAPRPNKSLIFCFFPPLSFFFISFLSFPHHRLSSLLLAYSFFTCDCRPVKVILNQSNPL